MRHRIRRSFSLGAAAALGLATLALGTGPDPLRPASSGGLVALDLALARLATHQRLLILAAHPDDEDTRLITWVARGRGGEAAYLSLSRGEGGQNLIGPELGPALGLLRSRELLAARQIDGARQFFTRAYDFGYTRSLEETLARWPQEALLADAVRVVRRFKPQVLVAIFRPTARVGHGQHWASGVVAEAVFDRAGDPEAFPELEREGLAPWKIDAFYRLAWDVEEATLELPLGVLEPWSGRSILQLALASRSQHRCQDMGLVQRLGEATDYLSWQGGAGGPEARDPFAGIDTRPAAIAAALPEGAEKEAVAQRLERVGELAAATRRELRAVEPEAATGPLAEIVRLLRQVHDELAAAQTGQIPLNPPAHSQVRELVAEKLALAQEALAIAAQVVADAVAERDTVVPGAELTVRSIFWNAGSSPVESLTVSVVSPGGWRLVASEPAPPETIHPRYATRTSDERRLTVAVPAASPPTVPYFLRRPLRGALYDWDAADPGERGEPFGRPPLTLRFAFTLAGVPVELEREVVQRLADQARGEVRRPLRVVPRLEVAVAPELVVWPLGDKKEERLQVEVRSNVEAPIRARVEAVTPPPWPAPAPQEVAIDEPLGRTVVELVLAAPAGVAPGRYPIAVAAVTDGVRFDHAYPLIEYEHVRPTPQPRPAQVVVSAGEIRLPARRRVACIRGRDQVPELLRRIGVPVEEVTARELAGRDLAAFDAIVVGSRAYETDPALARVNSRLLAYAREGGLVIVQYQQYQFVGGGFTPFPLTINRPHDRVTDETAPVRILVPEHPVFSRPNPIGPGDWEGWVQERGLYFAGTWDEAFEPLLAMADPGQEEKQGALLVARVGAGYYVYTGLAFFRQLPAGVTGACRLFANLLALNEPPPPDSP